MGHFLNFVCLFVKAAQSKMADRYVTNCTILSVSIKDVAGGETIAKFSPTIYERLLLIQS